MVYYKNNEAAKKYGVARTTIINWIEQAKQGRYKLEIYEENEKAFLANTSKNHIFLEKLAREGKKFKRTDFAKRITPKKEFYSVFNDKEILDILHNIDVYNEIPVQYTYFNAGADLWDEYVQRLAKEGTVNFLTNTILLLDLNLSYIYELIQKYKHINVIDIGVGNAYPVKSLLKFLLEKGLIQKYIGIDISQEMLTIAENNLHSWFGNALKVETYVRDINCDKLEDLLYDPYFKSPTQEPQGVNLILYLGGTVSNQRTPDRSLESINCSMGKNDILLFSKKLDTENSRSYFEFFIKDVNEKLSDRHRFVIDLLNIQQDDYESKQFYSKKEKSRFIQLTFLKDIQVEIKVGNTIRYLTINNGDKIILWRSLHQNFMDISNQLEKIDFDILQTTKSPDKEYILVIAGVKQPNLI